MQQRLEQRGRHDDREEAIQARMQVFEEDTNSMIKFIEENSSVPIVRVDATGTIDQVTQRILVATERYRKESCNKQNEEASSS